MKILAIESSCDETAAAVVEDGRRVISSVIASQVKEHILYGGVVPEIASRRHAEAISGVVGEALDRAEMNVGDVDAIAVTYAPGLIGALLVGVNFAKGLAFSANKPLVPVHHLRSHIAANYITHPDLGAAVSRARRLRRSQPHNRGARLHGFPYYRQNARRRGRRGDGQGGARHGARLSRQA